MKYIYSLFISFFNLFIIFSLFSFTISFEHLPIWTNNAKTSTLPNDLLNSEIVDFAIDNSTNSILYLINENGNSYLYIKNKKYPNKYKDKLKYFSSPLIENGGEYYFCSSLNHIIKLDSNGEMKEIQNQNYLNNENNYELKCFYHRKENVIVSVFINTNYIDFYSIEDSRWETLYDDDFHLKIEGKIFDANTYNIEERQLFWLGVFYKRESEFFLSLCKYNDYGYQMYCENEISLGNNFYSNNQLSFGKGDNRVYIFTYKENEMNQYNFYYINTEWGKCLNSEGNAILRIFKEAEIYDAYFIENSPVLVYVIRKLVKNGQYNFYL